MAQSKFGTSFGLPRSFSNYTSYTSMIWALGVSLLIIKAISEPFKFEKFYFYKLTSI